MTTDSSNVHNQDATNRLPQVKVSGKERAHQVLTTLLQDNASYMAGEVRPQAELSSCTVRHTLSRDGQHPQTAVVACADSRVAPEIVFAAGLGRLFTVRNAGNVMTEGMLASLEFAVTTLNVPLVLVLGHTQCGAITAALAMAKRDLHQPQPHQPATGPNHPCQAPSLLDKHIARIAHVVKAHVDSVEDIKDGVLSNVRYGVRQLKAPQSPISNAYSAGDIDIVGAIYDIHSGQVFVVDQ